MKSRTKIAIAVAALLAAAPVLAAGSLLLSYKREIAAKERARDAYPYPVRIEGREVLRENGDPLTFDTQEAADAYARQNTK